MMNQSEYVIEAADLGYQVGRQQLLRGINLRVRPGEHWLIYGMNGCGKTTLLSILAGFRRETQGTLKVFGQTLTNENILASRQRIGWISSSFFDGRYHHERVLDIVLSGKFGTYGLDLDLTSQDYKRAQALLTALGLADKYHQSYDRLSKGQRQNVLIARAFMHKPDILLLDEPCSGLDVLAKARFMALLSKLMQRQDLTVFFVSHEVGEVQALFDHTLLLRNGRVFNQGPTAEMLADDELSAFFQEKVTAQVETTLQIHPLDGRRALDAKLFM